MCTHIVGFILNFSLSLGHFNNSNGNKSINVPLKNIAIREKMAKSYHHIVLYLGVFVLAFSKNLLAYLALYKYLD